MKYEILKFLKRLFIKPIINLKKELGYKEQFEALKQYVDVRTLKTATGELRNIQLRNLQFTKEIIEELELNGIIPFMSAGTLLGAERHKGFIPWDDDIDFWLMRKDYERVITYAKTKYSVYEQSINRYHPFVSTQKRIKQLLSENPNKTIVILYPFIKFIKGTSTADCVQFDIFPMDYYSDDYDYSEHIKYCQNLNGKLWNINNTSKELTYIQQEYKNNSNIVDNSNTISYGLDNPGAYIPSQRTGWWNQDDFFPLKKMKFEDTEFYAPNNHIKILDYWCKNWREIPDNVLPPHANEKKT